MLQELQTQSHEGQSGVRDPETGRDRKRERERQGSREHGRQGAGAEKARGPRALGKEQAQKGAFSTRAMSGEATETDAGAEAVRAKRETPTPRTGGPPRPEKEQGATATETTQGIAGRGEVWELGSFWGSQERDPKDLGGPSVYEGHREEKPRGNEG